MRHLSFTFLFLVICNIALAEGVTIGNGIALPPGEGVSIGNGYAQNEQGFSIDITCDNTNPVELEQKVVALTKSAISKVSNIAYNYISISSQLNRYTPYASQKHKLHLALVAELQSTFGPNAYTESLDESSVYVSDLVEKLFASFVHNCSL